MSYSKKSTHKRKEASHPDSPQTKQESTVNTASRALPKKKARTKKNSIQKTSSFRPKNELGSGVEGNGVSFEGTLEMQQITTGAKKSSSTKRMKTRLSDPSGSEDVDIDEDLEKQWREQSRQRRRGEWKPTGNWKAPKWCPLVEQSNVTTNTHSAAATTISIKTDIREVSLHSSMSSVSASGSSRESKSLITQRSTDPVNAKCGNTTIEDNGAENGIKDTSKRSSKGQQSALIAQNDVEDSENSVYAKDRSLSSSIESSAKAEKIRVQKPKRKSQNNDVALKMQELILKCVDSLPPKGFHTSICPDDSAKSLGSVCDPSQNSKGVDSIGCIASSGKTSVDCSIPCIKQSSDDSSESDTNDYIDKRRLKVDDGVIKPACIGSKGNMNESVVMTKKESVETASSSKIVSKKSKPSLKAVNFPYFVSPSPRMVDLAHTAISSLLPPEDCEADYLSRLATRYAMYWRPKKPRIILLAESHVFTTLERASKGPILASSISTDEYDGPRQFISLVYCLAYGENDALEKFPAFPECDYPNKGTPQFWTLLAACARGELAIQDAMSKQAKNGVKGKPTSFALDLLKAGKLPWIERVRAKLKILKDLKRRGVWLIDCSVVGWYISQPPKYRKTRVTKEIHRSCKERPPKNLKAPTLIMSWEIYTKHLVREAANDGCLKLVIPIGKEVEAALTRERIQEALIPGATVSAGSKSETKSCARLLDAFPAPNAWIPGGYGPFLLRLAHLVDEEALPIPPSVSTSVSEMDSKEPVQTK